MTGLGLLFAYTAGQLACRDDTDANFDNNYIIIQLSLYIRNRVQT